MSNVWKCAIGPAPSEVPDDGDLPLRRAVCDAFAAMFKDYAAICESGWGFDEVTIGEAPHVCLSDAQREAVRKAESILRVIHSGITTDLRAAFPECFDEPSTDPATAQRKAGF